MFGFRKGKACATIDTIIGQHTRLEGDIRFSGGLHIDGQVRGNIRAEPGSEAVLTVSEHGRIEGDVEVPNLILNGSVVGDVVVSGRVEMASRGRVNGNLYYNLIEMAMGAEVNGSMVHRGESLAAATGPAPEPEQTQANAVEEHGLSPGNT